ncbi:aspartyl protease family protein [Sphingomonas sp. MMS24-J45]|uniref:aspartyl protease family protein n=1 Tax=Sphingomonas sp. MMS24-J45 TaxID=3238806 RepID=UPI00384B332E
MRALLALPLLIAAAPQPAATDVLAPDAEARWIAFELTTANQIRFSAIVDGQPVSAILDTGVSMSLLSRNFVDRARLHITSGPAAIAIGGAVAGGSVNVGQIRIGALTRHLAHLATAPLPDAATGGTPVDLLVGRDVTQGYALDIDYDARRFRMLPSGRLPFRGSTAPLRIAGTWPGYVTEISIGAARITRILIDTGDGGAVTLRKGVWDALPEAKAPTTSTIAYGIGGPSEVDLAIVPALRSGTLTARTVETRIEPDTGYTRTIGMNGRIGSGFLAGYRVLVDPAAGRMVLSPGKHADAPPFRSTSGLVLRVEPDRLTVLHVMRGGPAEADGWRTGAQICRVDDAAITPDTPLRWPVDRPGRTVRLGLCDGTKKTLTLRHFY